MTLPQRVIEQGRNLIAGLKDVTTRRRPYPPAPTNFAYDFGDAQPVIRQPDIFEPYKYSPEEQIAIHQVQSLLVPLIQGANPRIANREKVMIAAHSLYTGIEGYRQRADRPLARWNIDIPGRPEVAGEIAHALVDPRVPGAFFYDGETLYKGNNASLGFIQPVDNAKGLYIVGLKYLKSSADLSRTNHPDDFVWTYQLVGEEANTRNKMFYGEL